MKKNILACLFAIPLFSCNYNIKDCREYDTAVMSQVTEFDTADNNDNDDGTFFGFPFYQTDIGMGTDQFSTICQNPDAYLECFSNFVMDKRKNYRKKHMALYSMQRLPIDKYAVVIRVINSAFSQGLVKEETVRSAITQDGIWNNTTLIYFSNVKFQKEFKAIVNNSKLSAKTRNVLKKYENEAFRMELLLAFKKDRGE